MKTKRGIYAKYIVTRTDGKPHKPQDRFFVLNFGSKNKAGNRACKAALRAYADSIEHTEPKLAIDLRYACETGHYPFEDEALAADMQSCDKRLKGLVPGGK